MDGGKQHNSGSEKTLGLKLKQSDIRFRRWNNARRVKG